MEKRYDKKAIIERIKARILYRPGSRCWHYCGIISDLGYGIVKIGGRRTRVHRIVYEYYVGPIPAGLTINHLCHVRHCVNPDHMEVVTLRENLSGWRSGNRIKTHCPHGHPYDEANTRWYAQKVPGRALGRMCKTCERARCKIRQRRYRVQAKLLKIAASCNIV